MKTLADVETLLAEARSRSSPTVTFVSGVFNVLHPGHLRLLRFAKEQGDILVVGVYSDRLALDPQIKLPERIEGVEALAWVDHAFDLDQPHPEVLLRLRPDLVIKGKEWGDKPNVEEEVLRQYGGRLLFSSGEFTFSAVDLMREEFKQRTAFAPSADHDYLRRRGITSATLQEAIGRFEELNVLVLGDTIIDEYIFCDALGMSQEDPVLVVRPFSTERYVGGAAIVAMHARKLGAKVRFASVVGEDEAGGWVHGELSKEGIEPDLLLDGTRPTTLKQRYIANGKKLLRVSQLREHALSPDLVRKVDESLDALLDGVDLAIFSDFNYGYLCDQVLERTIPRCRAAGIVTSADSQCSSQIGDIGRYVGVDLVTPTEREARITLHEREAGLVILAHKLQQRIGSKNVILTLGKDGVLIHHPRSAEPMDFETDSIPALNKAPKDPLGAGDAFLVGSSLALAAGQDPWAAAYIGSLCAAYEVSCVGNHPVSRHEIVRLLDGSIQ